MSAPALSIGAREVLRALAIGIELRSADGEWKFVGPWQDEATSGVPKGHVSELLAAGFALLTKTNCVEITKLGQEWLASFERGIVDEGMQWLRSRASPLLIC
jgi:hypothetical protein